MIKWIIYFLDILNLYLIKIYIIILDYVYNMLQFDK